MASPSNRIRELRVKAGLTLEALATAAGTSNQQISRLESGQRKLTLDWMVRLAPILEVEPKDLIGDTPGPPRPRVKPRTGAPSKHGPLAGPIGARTLPVVGRAKGGAEGVILIHEDALTQPIDWTYRPPQLADVPDAFAFFTVSDSMWPALKAGDIGWVHPHMPVAPGHEVLVVRMNDEAIVKVLAKRNPDQVLLTQYNPAGVEFTIPNEEIRHIYRVVGKWGG